VAAAESESRKVIMFADLLESCGRHAGLLGINRGLRWMDKSNPRHTRQNAALERIRQ